MKTKRLRKLEGCLWVRQYRRTRLWSERNGPVILEIQNLEGNWHEIAWAENPSRIYGQIEGIRDGLTYKLAHIRKKEKAYNE